MQEKAAVVRCINKELNHKTHLIMKSTSFWKALSALYIVYYVFSIIILVLIAFHVVPFTMMQLEWWQVSFIPIIAPLMFFIESIVIPAPVPMIIWGSLVALGLFVLYKAVKYLTK